jgi:hypothetical protein
MAPKVQIRRLGRHMMPKPPARRQADRLRASRSLITVAQGLVIRELYFTLSFRYCPSCGKRLEDLVAANGKFFKELAAARAN